MKRLREGERREKGASFEAEGKGVSVRWDREAAHADKDDKCSERGGEEGVSSNHGVVAKG